MNLGVDEVKSKIKNLQSIYNQEKKEENRNSLIDTFKDLKDLHGAIYTDENEEDCFDAFGDSVAKQLS